MSKIVLATALDVVFTVAMPYIAGPLDLWGHTFKAVAKTVAKKNTKRIGQKDVVTLWDDFLRGPVPKIKGYMSSAATKIREVVWGSTRVVAPNVTNTAMGVALSKSVDGVTKLLEKDSTGKIINFMLNFTSLGGTFACLLQLGDSKRPQKKGIEGIIEDGTGKYVYFP